ncbi:MAG TPA: zinc-ribbon domain-containing protein, partial [Gaiellales bacterium]|nr:zinc-ribbon domain-containing protein [Gaiellales bacterium]
MSACPSCGFENPENRDFCPKCGSYTRWDPTVHVAAVRPSTPDAEQKDQEEEPPAPILTGVPAAVAEGVIVTVRKAGDEAADAPVELTLVPGSQALLTINVRNQSG